jgi:lysine-specific demethylase 8
VFQNFFVQVRGRKKFMLYAPDEAPRLHYPEPSFPHYHLHFSPVTVEDPDLARHPRFREARGVELVVEAGQVLHIPSGWWHYVRGLEPSISLNFWWANERVLVDRAPFMARRFLRSWRRRRSIDKRPTQ